MCGPSRPHVYFMDACFYRRNSLETMLRTMSLSELLDSPFHLYRKHFVVFCGIVAISNLIILLFTVAESSFHFLSSRIAIFIFLLLVSIAYFFAQAAVISAVSQVHLGRPASIGASFAAVKGSMVEVIFAIILTVTAIVFGLIFCLVPGMYLLVVWSLTIPVVIIENRGPLEAIKRSFFLTKGSWFRIFLVLFMVTVIMCSIAFTILIPVFVLMIIWGMQNPQGIPVWILVLFQISIFIATCVAVPISLIATSLIYYDQRVRKEGFDLQLMIAAIKSKQHSNTVSPGA